MFLKEAVVEHAQLTSILDDYWATPNIQATYAIWRYMGTETGIMRINPGTDVVKKYDPTQRSW